MSTSTVVLSINGTDFEAEVEYSPGTHVPAKLFGLPEDCHPDESEDLIIHSLHILIKVCGIDTKQDVWFLVDSLTDDIKEQLRD